MSVVVLVLLTVCIVSEHHEWVPWTRKEDKRRAREGRGNATFHILLAKFELLKAM